MRRVSWMIGRTAVCWAAVVLGVRPGAAAEIGFEEPFALAADRQAVLGELVPGTEEFFYFHALHLLNTEQFDAVEPLLGTWVKEHGETPRVWEIRNRRALLTYDADPKASFDYLVRRLGLTFPHQREVPGAEPQLPTALDPALVTPAAWQARAQAADPHGVERYEDAALDALVARAVAERPEPIRLRQLLSRLTRPDHPGLVPLVAADLGHGDSGGFGSLGIHRQLLVDQLEELATLRAGLLDEPAFVTAMLAKLQPGPDDDWQFDDDARAAYLERLRAFVDRLAPVHNSLKAHVRYHQLDLGRRRGRWNKEEFLAYLALPRRQGYVATKLLETDLARAFPCDLASNGGGAFLLPPIGGDEPLVRDFLAHFLVDAADTKEFEPFVAADYLRRLWAETKLTHGLGDQDRWAAILGPADFRALKDRVEIALAPTNPRRVAADAPVALDATIKHVDTLTVRIFEIDTRGHYRRALTEVDTDIVLDGLTPNHEFTVAGDADPLRRVERRIELPHLAGPGVYVVDLIGNGTSSRALVRKGRLRALPRSGPTGQSFTILDDAGRIVPDAVLWLEGREFAADADGRILVPYSTAPGRKPIVITAPVRATDGDVGSLSSLDAFDHLGEDHQLAVAFHVDRESLAPGHTAEVLLRPSLSVGGVPVSLSLVEKPKLTITTTDLDGVPTVKEVPDVALAEDRELTYEFAVPRRLAAVTFTLSGRVPRLTAGGEPQDLAASETFAINGILRTDRVEDLFLVRSAERYLVEVRGRSGEPRPSRAVAITLKARDYRDPLVVSLKTDAIGVIDLGPLDGIATVTAQGPEGTSHVWPIDTDAAVLPRSVHGRVGEPIRLPLVTRSVRAGAPLPAEPSRGILSLLELRGDTFSADRFEHLAIEEGAVVIAGLEPGDYDLLFKDRGDRVLVRVVAGEATGGYYVGDRRQLEAPRLARPTIDRLEPRPAPDGGDGTELLVQLRGTSPFTRVHVIATRMVPEFDLFADLARIRGPEPWAFSRSPFISAYVSGRRLGDEYSYILRRRETPTFAGSMLERPSLLLHPWATEETRTSKQDAQGGDAFAAVAPPAPAAAEAAQKSAAAPAGREGFANLDFLAQPGIVIANLVPGEDGTLVVPAAALRGHQHLTVAVVDPLATVIRSVALPAVPAEILDLRLQTPLDPDGHLVQRQTVTVVEPGTPFTLDDVAASRFEAYDSLPTVFRLYTALSANPDLATFAFLLRWPGMEEAEKRALYSEHACHELNFFLSRKDPEFFAAVVRPGLESKKDRTFLDHYLLGDDLVAFLEPWAYGQLNAVERTLLAERIAAERERTTRHFGDRLALQPPDVEKRLQLFEAALATAALDIADTSGLDGIRAQTASDPALLALGVPASATVGRFGLPNAPGGMGGGMGSGGMGGGGLGGQLADEPMAASDALEAGEAMDEKAGRDAAGKRKESLRRAAGRQLRERMGEEDRAKDGRIDALAEQERPSSFFDSAPADKASQLYRLLGPTREWAESNYRRLRIAVQGPDLVAPNAFWLDYVKRDPQRPFCSTHLAEATGSFTEMMLALAVLDLPIESPQHESRVTDGRLALDAGGPLVMFHEETITVDPPPADGTILVGQNMLRHGDRTMIVAGEQVDKFVTGEFLTHVVYACRVVVTNPTSTRRKVSVLVQIPQGSIPVLGGKATRTVPLVLEPYATGMVEYHFYFPLAGTFRHYPVHVSSGGELVAAVPPRDMTVVERPTQLDEQSWEAISQDADAETLLTYLDTHNLDALPLERIAWRMRDPEMFDAVVARLAARHVWSPVLWSYAFLHGRPGPAGEWLRHQDGFVAQCGGRLVSPLLVIDPVARRTYEHLEYAPLVNARAHLLGTRRQIVNDRLHAQYHAFLRELCHVRELSADDRLAVVTYLLMQDRIAEAVEHVALVRRDAVATPLQYDYCRAWLALVTGDTATARTIAATHAAEGIDRWRNRFATLVAHVDEAEGAAGRVVDPRDRGQAQDALAATAPALEMRLDGDAIVLDVRNLPAVELAFYEMDVEVLFSRNPFAGTFAGQFSSVRPNRTLRVEFDAATASRRIPLPDDLARRNLLVEASGGGIARAQPHYASGLAVELVESYGQLRVTRRGTGGPVPKAYVKVYARLDDGSETFYKDGYTDLRGRFDYASLSTDDASRATRFSILVLGVEDGAVIKEAAPPGR